MIALRKADGTIALWVYPTEVAHVHAAGHDGSRTRIQIVGRSEPLPCLAPYRHVVDELMRALPDADWIQSRTSHGPILVNLGTIEIARPLSDSVHCESAPPVPACTLLESPVTFEQRLEHLATLRGTR